EAIAFSLCYASELSNQSSRRLSLIRAANTNMFQSSIFRDTFTTVTGANIELYNTDGAIGAAVGAGIGAGVCGYEILAHQAPLEVITPQANIGGALRDAYERWKGNLSQFLQSS
ncbi:MAG: carbohydrate kinase, partial [Bdellovibrionota bacterium]